MSITLRSKLNGMLETQKDEAFLEAAHLPRVPKSFNGPVIANVSN